MGWDILLGLLLIGGSILYAWEREQWLQFQFRWQMYLIKKDDPSYHTKETIRVCDHCHEIYPKDWPHTWCKHPACYASSSGRIETKTVAYLLAPVPPRTFLYKPWKRVKHIRAQETQQLLAAYEEAALREKASQTAL